MKLKTPLILALGALFLAESAYTQVADDPKLPRVLLIGDSVSMGYTAAVRNELAGRANVHRPAANCGSTKIGLRDLDKWLGTGKWDVIHFNFGLHDLGYRFDNDSNQNAAGDYARPDNGGHQNVPPDQYERNLRELIARLKRTGAKLIFATTTPVPADLHSYVKGAEAPYNQSALRVMRQTGVHVNDLWSFAMRQLDQIQSPGNPHFTTRGSEALAREVARHIAQELSQQQNRNSISMQVNIAAGSPVLFADKVPAGFNPDSVRVTAAGSPAIIPSKTEWRGPDVRVSWISPGPGAYLISFDVRGSGQTERLPEPAMVGTGDRITYGRLGVRGRLSVGLWAFPAAIDMDGDGNLDLIVSCSDHPYNGVYLFRNLGTNDKPLFDRAEWLGKGIKDLVAADFNGDGAIDLVVSGGYYSDVRKNRLSRFVPVKLPRKYWIGRDDLWYPVDWDGDGKIDLLTGVSDWRDYGWDDAFNEKGVWTRGPLHGFVYFHRNIGNNEQPRYAEPEMVRAAGNPIDRYGSPTPNPVDWLGTGKLDLVSGNFLDSISLFRNTGTRSAPNLAAAEPLRVSGKPLRLDLCMIQPRVVQWHKDGRPSLLVGEEDGRIAFLENRAPRGKEPDFAPLRYLEQVDPLMKSGALSRPVAFDWNGDGKLDLLAGNSAGYIQYFENTGTSAAPAFEDRGYLKAAGKVIRHMAGPNGSVQGPAEEKWGYTNISVADWDLDGKPDILVNDITGAVVWYRNTGTRTAPELAAAQPVDVEWTSRPPKPDWVWWEPKGKQLVTQWRTTPKVVDWDRDGLPDLVMLNHQGYLSLYRRARKNGSLVLLPPERIFLEPGGRFLNLAAGRAGASGRRKIELADWDGDGDLDLITDSADGPVWYENVGTQAKPVMQFRGLLLKTKFQGHNPTANVADWNGDGKPDLIVGAEDGFFYYFERSFIDRK